MSSSSSHCTDDRGEHDPSGRLSEPKSGLKIHSSVTSEASSEGQKDNPNTKSAADDTLRRRASEAVGGGLDHPHRLCPVRMRQSNDMLHSCCDLSSQFVKAKHQNPREAGS